MVKVEYTGQFYLGLKKLLDGKPHLRLPVQEHIRLFQKNPNDTRLSNHALHKRLLGKWAFSVSDDIRIIYCFVGKNAVRFLTIGTHETVYKRR